LIFNGPTLKCITSCSKNFAMYLHRSNAICRRAYGNISAYTDHKFKEKRMAQNRDENKIKKRWFHTLSCLITNLTSFWEHKQILRICLVMHRIKKNYYFDKLICQMNFRLSRRVLIMIMIDYYYIMIIIYYYYIIIIIYYDDYYIIKL
jgi:hypothetical protein